VKRLLQLVLVLIVVSASIFGCAPAQEPEEETKEPIKVGVVYTLTTSLASYGTPMLMGVRMAVDEINAEGGINGRPLELIIEDSSNSNDVAVNALQKVLLQDPLVILGPIIGSQMLAMRPIIDSEGVPVFTISGTRKVTYDNNEWVFRNGAFAGVYNAVMIKFAVEQLGVTKPCALCLGNEFGYSLRDVGNAWLRNHGYDEFHAVEVYQSGDQDMSAQLLSLKDAGCDAILHTGFIPDSALVAKQAKSLDIGLPMIYADTVQAAAMSDITEAGDVEGIYLEAPNFILDAEEPDPDIAAWAQRFQDKMGSDQYISSYTLSVYDGIYMMAKAMRIADERGELTREGIRKVITEPDFEYVGLLYPKLKADHEGNMGNVVNMWQYGANKKGHMVWEAEMGPDDVIYEY
jgi:branched-chain amino acid transport system substrate-binding protein